MVLNLTVQAEEEFGRSLSPLPLQESEPSFSLLPLHPKKEGGIFTLAELLLLHTMGLIA